MAEIPMPSALVLKLTTERQSELARSSSASEERSSIQAKMCAKVDMIHYSQPLTGALNSAADVEESL